MVLRFLIDAHIVNYPSFIGELAGSATGLAVFDE